MKLSCKLEEPAYAGLIRIDLIGFEVWARPWTGDFKGVRTLISYEGRTLSIPK